MIREEFDLQPLLRLQLRLQSIVPDGDGDVADRARGSCPPPSIVQL